jgi:hypothetical protein
VFDHQRTIYYEEEQLSGINTASQISIKNKNEKYWQKSVGFLTFALQAAKRRTVNKTVNNF